MSNDRVDFLAKVSAFRGVDKEGLKRLSGICNVVERPAGEVIIKEGEEGDCVYIIEKGQVEISMSISMVPSLDEPRSEPIDKVLVRLDPGAMFGEMAFIFDRDVRSATIVALTDVRLLSITSSDFGRLANEDVNSAYIIISNIARIIAERLRKSNQDVKKLTTVLSVALRKPRRS